MSAASYSGSSTAAPGGQILRREEIFAEYAGSNFTISGYIDASVDLGFELVPLLFATTGPIGTVTKDAFDRITAETWALLRAGGEVASHLSPPYTHGAKLVTCTVSLNACDIRRLRGTG